MAKNIEKKVSANPVRLSVGVIIPELRKYGGAERFLIECLVRWQFDHDITVYASVFDQELLSRSGLQYIKTSLLSPQFEGEHATLLNAILLPKIWQSEVGQHDVYHSHLWPTHLLNLHPIVWYPHEPLRMLYDLRLSNISESAVEGEQQKIHFYPKESYDSVEGRTFKSLLSAISDHDLTGRPDRIIANSKYTANYLARVYSIVPPDVVYPGVTVEDTLALPTDPNLIVTIGQLWPHKRIRIIIEAIAEVEGVQLYIIGSGPERERLEQLSRRMGVGDRVFFLSGLDNHQVQILLSRCLCVVFAPVREPFGIVALEALAAGKPLIAVNEGGFTEVVDENCARLVPPQPSAISEAIRELIGNPDEAGRLGRNGKEIAACYSWDKTASQLLSIIEETYVGWQNANSGGPPKAGPIFAIHYFNWYKEGLGNAHWCDNPATGWVNDTSILGYYSSLDSEAISAHLRDIESCGIDVVIFNIHVDESGINLFQLASAQKMQLLSIQENRDVEFFVNFCFYTDRVDLIQQSITMVKTSLLKEKKYHNFDGKAAVGIFWTGVFDGNIAVIEALRKNLSGMFRVGVFMRPSSADDERQKTFDLFDCASQFSPLELGPTDEWNRIWQREFDSSGQSSGARCVTITPGYDDSHLSDPNRRGIRRIDRKDGEIYQVSMDFALEQDITPSFIFITSFNEFHEGSHIESSRRFGSKYLEMTKDFIRTAKSKWKAGRNSTEQSDAN